MKTYIELARNHLYGTDYCPECGSKLKEVKRTPDHDGKTGKFLGYSLEKRCSSSLFKCGWRRLGARWIGYEGAYHLKEEL